jgi:hypothetical protein
LAAKYRTAGINVSPPHHVYYPFAQVGVESIPGSETAIFLHVPGYLAAYDYDVINQSTINGLMAAVLLIYGLWW